MKEGPPQQFIVEGVPVLWLNSSADADGADHLYTPAVLAELTLNFRSLRAGLNHSEDRSYTAWLPPGDLAIDWDSPAVKLNDETHLSTQPDSQIAYAQGDYEKTKENFEEWRDELVDRLSRNERLRLFSNPVFGLFSSPGDRLEDFLYRVADAALGRVEPELRMLRHRFDLQIEQITEAQTRRGFTAEGLNVEALLLSNLHLFESENRLASIFSTLAGTVFGTKPSAHAIKQSDVDAELQDDLNRLEQEARDALSSLYAEYMALANEYDMFEIGLQPDNIQILKLALLWIPVAPKS